MSILIDGEKIKDTYEVEAFLGEGAFAEVYRVKHRFLGRQAMKILKRKGMSVDEIEDLLHEALLLSRIGHPNIVRVFDANIHEKADGIFGFFTMEYVPGGSVDKYWKSYGSKLMPIDTVLEITKQVCRGLSVAHSEDPPIVHRDIKPQNVLVGYDGTGIRARIADFGLARKVNPLSFLASARGTPCFKAPECLRDFQMDSIVGDVWALGTMFYLMLTDRLPYPECIDIASVNLSCFEQPPPSPEKFNAGVNKAMSSIALKCLEKEPQNRFQSAMEVLEALENWKPGQRSKRDLGEMSSVYSKTSFGHHSPPDQSAAKQMAEQAIVLSKQSGRLMEAADVMEQVINKDQDLRKKYEHLVQLWRRGINM